MGRGRFSFAVLALCGAGLLFGCGGDEREIYIVLKTDLTGIAEFSSVDAEEITNTTVRSVITHAAAGTDYTRGTQIAAFTSSQESGLTRFRITLRAADGAYVAGRDVAVPLASERQTVTVLIDRDCRGVRCDSPSAPACLGGQCVDDECSEENPAACGEAAAECMVDTDCPAPGVACAAARCSSGVCIEVPNVNCAVGEYCDVRSGCEAIPVSMPSAVMDASVDAGMDVSMDGSDAEDADASDTDEPELCVPACVAPVGGSVTCVEGLCQESCPGGLTNCAGVCRDTQSDNDHCGECRNDCPGDRVCGGGECICPGGGTECDGTCVDLTSDSSHCGMCNRVCTAPSSCEDSDCLLLCDKEDDDLDLRIDEGLYVVEAAPGATGDTGLRGVQSRAGGHLGVLSRNGSRLQFQSYDLSNPGTIGSPLVLTNAVIDADICTSSSEFIVVVSTASGVTLQRIPFEGIPSQPPAETVSTGGDLYGAVSCHVFEDRGREVVAIPYMVSFPGPFNTTVSLATANLSVAPLAFGGTNLEITLGGVRDLDATGSSDRMFFVAGVQRLTGEIISVGEILVDESDPPVPSVRSTNDVEPGTLSPSSLSSVFLPVANRMVVGWGSTGSRYSILGPSGEVSRSLVLSNRLWLAHANEGVTSEQSTFGLVQSIGLNLQFERHLVMGDVVYEEPEDIIALGDRRDGVLIGLDSPASSSMAGPRFVFFDGLGSSRRIACMEP